MMNLTSVNAEHPELQLKDDECCIIFNFGCYFPYSNSDILTFEFSLGDEKLEDWKMNHRFPNKGWQTISRKYGRKISKLGYPYIMKLDKQGPMILALKIGIKEKFVTLLFPITINMTKDKPICVLDLHYYFEENKFYLSSFEKIEKGCWHEHRWLSPREDDDIRDSDIILGVPRTVKASKFTVIYDDIITPFPMPL